jgi:hypothetical protein
MAHHLACARFSVAKLGNLIPTKFIEALEQNQQISSCCRHPENHEIEAFYSCDEIKETGVPDIYIFHCTCGKKHRRFCIGMGDVRPHWEVR